VLKELPNHVPRRTGVLDRSAITRAIGATGGIEKMVRLRVNVLGFDETKRIRSTSSHFFLAVISVEDDSARI
jgi:hypothetical protein